MDFASPLTIMKKSFRAKIFVMAALIIIVISCSFTLFFISHDKNTQTSELARQGELLASLLGHNTRLGVFAGDAAMLSEAAEGIMRHRDVISVSLYGKTGALLFHESKPGKKEIVLQHHSEAKVSLPTAPSRTVGDATIEITAPILAETNAGTADSLFFAGKGAAPPSNIIGSVRIILDKADVNARINRLITIAMLCMGLFLLLGSLCAYIIVRGITRPLMALMEGVDVLAAHGIYRKVTLETEDEIGSLAGAFNGMIDSLQRREQENRQLEEQLRHAQKREAREEWEQTFDTVPDLIAILDREQRIIRINRALAEHFGIGKDEAIGLDAAQLCGDWITGRDSHEAVAPGSSFECETYEEVRDCWYWLTISPLMRMDREQAGTVHVARDITQRKKGETEKKAMQAKLIQTNKMTSLGLLVSGMAHEVNNPNSNIMFTAHLLGKAWKDAETVLDRYYREEGDFRVGGHWYSQIRDTLPHHISGIRDNARRIEGIIKNLKDFVRKGKAELSTEMDINRIISVAVSLINNQIKRHTSRFQVQFAEQLPIVKGNPQQLEQVFINLIMNSLQALPDRERQVSITTSADEDCSNVVVRISDEGCGMTAEVKANAFEPFFSTKLDCGGTGLGLAISKFILDEHKANIRFDSEPDSGTTVTILLPVNQESARGKVSAA